MFQKNLIMTQYQINFLHNKKDYWQVLPGGTLCQLMEQIRPKTGNPLEFLLGLSMLLLLLLLRLPNVSNKYYHDIGSDYFSENTQRRTGEYFLGETCIRSWSCYGLKRGIPW